MPVMLSVHDAIVGVQSAFTGMAGTAGAAGPNTTLLDGLVEYWPMNGESGDETGLHASIVIPVGMGSPGHAAGLVYDNARTVDAVSGFGMTASTIFSGSWTMTGWVYQTAIVWEEGDPFLYASSSRGGDPLPSSIVLAGIQISPALTLAAIVDMISGEGATIFAPGATLNAWHCVILTWDDDTDTLGLQIDGGDYNTQQASVALDPLDMYFVVGLEAGLTGRMGPIAVWDRVITTDERTAFYNSGNGLAYESF